MTSSSLLQDLLKKYIIPKDAKDRDKIEKTNTRIGCIEKNIYGGSYHIPPEEYRNFLRIYADEIVMKGGAEYLTEKQLDGKAPIVVDIDLRYEYKTEGHQYTDDHIIDLISLYLDTFKEMYILDGDLSFYIFVMEKNATKHLDEKNITKDGIHLLFTVNVEHAQQLFLRERIVEKIPEIWTGFPTTNSWEDVFDKGISTGKTNWQLYGSSKPDYEAYKVSKTYHITFNEEENDFDFHRVPLAELDVNKKENIHLLSVRNTENPKPILKPSILSRLEQFKLKNNLLSSSSSTTELSTPNGNINSLIPISYASYDDDEEEGSDLNEETENVSSREQIDALVERMKEKFRRKTQNDLLDVCSYVEALPRPYYENFEKWKRVGWVLRNIAYALLPSWIQFSSKWDKFNFYTDVKTLCNEWKYNKPSNKLTKRSLMFWVRSDAPVEYDKIRINSADVIIEDIIERASRKGGKCVDWDIANVLYNLYKDRFVCSSIKGRIWYQHIENRWVETDSGTKLRDKISREVKDLFMQKTFQLQRTLMSINEDEEKDKYKRTTEKMGSILNIVQRLGSTNDKNNVMTEAKEHFYDEDFDTNLDNSPHLICFKNGVVDIEKKVFRRGFPEDYISMTTHINYLEVLNENHRDTVEEIHDFMNKLFPIPELREYMWDHLASTLYGVGVAQTFNMYTGVGRNGKSMLVGLMEKILGDYICDVPLSMITEKRQKVGGVSPEIVQLKGKRYAVMQEPSKGDIINEGIMKQLTGGTDRLQGRAPYMPKTITFSAQFKLVLTCNNLMTVKSNDYGTWRRIRVVPFLSLFTENPVEGDPERPYQYLIDPNLPNKFDRWKEVFAHLLVQRVFQTGGEVKDCDVVMRESEKYQEKENVIITYIKERILTHQEGYILTKGEISSDFETWYKQSVGYVSGKNRPNMKEVVEALEAKFGAMKDMKYMNMRINYGTGQRGDIDDDNTDVDEITLNDL